MKTIEGSKTDQTVKTAEETTSEFDFARARRRRKNAKRALQLLAVALVAFVGWRYWLQRSQMIWSKTWPTTNQYRHQDAMTLELSGGFLYGLASDNTVHVVSAGTGKEAWTFRPPLEFYAAGLSVRDQLAVVLVKPERSSQRSTGTYLVGLDAFSGQEQWRLDAGMNVREGAVLVTHDSVLFTGGGQGDAQADGGALATADDGADAALDGVSSSSIQERVVAASLDGVVRWQAPLSGQGRIEQIGISVVVIQESKVDAFAASDGRSLWSQPVRRVAGYGFIEGIPRTVEILPWRGRVLVWQAPDRISVRDSTSGEELDQYRPTNLLSKGFGREALVVGDTLYIYSQFIGSGRDDVRAIDLTKKEVKWVSNIRAFYSGWPFGTSSYDSRPLAYSGRKIYLAARDGFVHGINVRSGESEYKKRIYKEGGGFDWNTPPIVRNGVLYITEPHYKEGSQTPIDLAAYKAG